MVCLHLYPLPHCHPSLSDAGFVQIACFGQGDILANVIQAELEKYVGIPARPVAWVGCQLSPGSLPPPQERAWTVRKEEAHGGKPAPPAKAVLDHQPQADPPADHRHVSGTSYNQHNCPEYL